MDKKSLEMKVKKIGAKLDEKKASTKNSSVEVEIRKLRKQLKRAQRKLSLIKQSEKRLAEKKAKKDKKAA